MKAIPREKLRRALVRASRGCRIQGPRPGWPCNSCFFAIDDELTEPEWQAVLLVRGDYTEAELDNLPADIPAAIRNVISIAEKSI